MTDEEWQKLQEKYGEGNIAAVEVSPGRWIGFCKPTRAEYDRWFDQQSADKKNQTKYARELEQACVVWPGAGKGDPVGHEAFKQALDHNPSLTMCECLDAVTGLAGLADRANIRK
jgi:hypothetical protein